MSFSLRAFTLGAAAAVLLSLPAQAAVFMTTLAGTNEVPPNASTGSGSAVVTLDGDTLTVDVDFTGLTLAAGAAHIHCCTLPGTNAPVAVGFPGFPSATSGSYSQAFDLSMAATYGAAYLAGVGGTVDAARTTLIAGLFDGLAYVNIHNSQFPGGEIRGQLAEVPEPMALSLLGLGLLGAGVLRRRKFAQAN